MVIAAKIYVLIMFFAIIAIVWAYLRTPPPDGDQMWPNDDYFD